ncbi:hypothetical protein V8C35DRAFT_316531 [Trichoderma chlorosporum]
MLIDHLVLSGNDAGMRSKSLFILLLYLFGIGSGQMWTQLVTKGVISTIVAASSFKRRISCQMSFCFGNRRLR